MPLDPAYPTEQLAFMLHDSQPRVLLTTQALAESLPSHAALVIRLDNDWEKIATESTALLDSEITAENLAYILYTSGSTGQPKGVAVPHRAIVRLVQRANYAQLPAAETFLHFAPLAFDASTFEIWGALANGARLAVFPPYIPSLVELGHVLQLHQVTTLWLTAGLFQQLIDLYPEGLRGVRQMLTGGDVVSVPHAQQVLRDLPDCRLIQRLWAY